MQDLPTKCVQETLELSIKAKLMYIDYEGQSDGESIKKLLSNIKPKNLVNILVNLRNDIDRLIISNQDYSARR